MKSHAYRPFLLTLLVCILLLLLHWLPTMRIGETELRRIDILSDLSSDSAKHDLHDVIPKPKEPRQLMAKSKDGKMVEFKEVWPKGVQRVVDFSEGKAGGMSHFYAMLDSVARKKLANRPLRIAFYGDSFIEGDILVADLRELLQTRFGGWGVGWIDAGNDLTQYKRTIANSFSGLTEHMAMKKQTYRASETGIAQRYYTMTAPVSISLTAKKDFPHTARWGVSRLYFRSSGNVAIEGQEGATPYSFSFKGSPNVQVAEMKGVASQTEFKIPRGNAILYGTALETDGGIVVDNFSLRGTSGNTLNEIPEVTLQEFNRLRPYDLIVLQFGVNAVTEKSTTETLKLYTDKMRRVVAHMRRCFPEASILVMGTPDRGSKTSADGTMPGIEMLTGFQEQLASDAQVSFLSILHAMGGPGSMRCLVDEHGWGSKDYVHINRDGGKFVARKIYDSFMAGYSNYLRRKKIEQQ